MTGFSTVAGEGFNNHHVVPNAIEGDSDLLMLFKEHGLYDQNDDHHNRLRMPTATEVAAVAPTGPFTSSEWRTFCLPSEQA